MSSTNTPSVRWVVGESTGVDETGATASLPSAFFQSTATTAPTAFDDGGGSNVFITSDNDVYLWNATAWVGPYSVAT